MLYLCNAFSIQMICGFRDIEVAFKRLEDETVAFNLLAGEKWTSAVGHADTAVVLSNLLGMRVDMNRINVTLTKDDALIVAQVVGGRLVEGAKYLPEGVRIEWWLVTPKPKQRKALL